MGPNTNKCSTLQSVEQNRPSAYHEHKHNIFRTSVHCTLAPTKHMQFYTAELNTEMPERKPENKTEHKIWNAPPLEHNKALNKTPSALNTTPSTSNHE